MFPSTMRLFIAAFVTLVFFYFFTPPIVSFDGKLYLASGKSLFSSEAMSSYYHWIREPLYPLIIFVSIKLGSLKFLLLLQMLMVAIGISLSVDRWVKISGEKWRKSFEYGAVVLASSLLHGYTTAVLQTSLYILLVGLFSEFVYRIRSNGHGIRNNIFFVALLSVFVSTLSLNAALSFLLLQILVIPFISHKRQSLRLCVGSFLVILACSFSWVEVKQSINNGGGYFKGVETPNEGIKLFLDPKNVNESLERIQQSPLSLLGLAPDRYVGLNFQQLSFEARIYGLPLTEGFSLCGKNDPSIPPIDDYVRNLLIENNCISIENSKALNVLNYGLGKSLPIFGFFFCALFFGFINSYRSKHLLVLAPTTILLPYVLLGAANSRYGAPATVYGAISFFNWLNRKTKESRQWNKGS